MIYDEIHYDKIRHNSQDDTERCVDCGGDFELQQCEGSERKCEGMVCDHCRFGLVDGSVRCDQCEGTFREEMKRADKRLRPFPPVPAGECQCCDQDLHQYVSPAVTCSHCLQDVCASCLVAPDFCVDCSAHFKSKQNLEYK